VPILNPLPASLRPSPCVTAHIVSGVYTVYIIKYFSPPVGWGYQLMLFGDKYKRGTGKGGKFERKRKKKMKRKYMYTCKINAK
jgi:hypothetical protein